MDLFGYRLYTFKSDKDILNHRATTSMTIGFITEIKTDDNINNDGFYTFNVQTNVSFLEEHDIDVNSLLFYGLTNHKIINKNTVNKFRYDETDLDPLMFRCKSIKLISIFVDYLKEMIILSNSPYNYVMNMNTEPSNDYRFLCYPDNKKLLSHPINRYYWTSKLTRSNVFRIPTSMFVNMHQKLLELRQNKSNVEYYLRLGYFQIFKQINSCDLQNLTINDEIYSYLSHNVHNGILKLTTALDINDNDITYNDVVRIRDILLKQCSYLTNKSKERITELIQYKFDSLLDKLDDEFINIKKLTLKKSDSQTSDDNEILIDDTKDMDDQKVKETDILYTNNDFDEKSDQFTVYIDIGNKVADYQVNKEIKIVEIKNMLKRDQIYSYDDNILLYYDDNTMKDEYSLMDYDIYDDKCLIKSVNISQQKTIHNEVNKIRIKYGNIIFALIVIFIGIIVIRFNPKNRTKICQLIMSDIYHQLFG